MIVIDSSVIIAHLRKRPNRSVEKFGELLDRNQIIIGDIVRLEVLQGARDDNHAGQLARTLNRFKPANMLDEQIAVEAARHFRYLRALGITIRKTTDLIIGTFCIVENHVLLHDDRDFDPMQRHLGLQVA
jgi:predicted nucleic acid-binding protein